MQAMTTDPATESPPVQAADNGHASEPVAVPATDFTTLPPGVELVEVRKGFGFGTVGGAAPAPAPSSEDRREK